MRTELADVFLGVLRLADVAGVDITTAAKQKLRWNAGKYSPGHTGPEPPGRTVATVRAESAKAVQSRNFDGDIFGVDFSGARDAGKAIWIANGRTAEDRLVVERCVRLSDLEDSGRDRDLALAALRRVVREHPNGVFGLDFPFSLPRPLIDHDWESFLQALKRNHPTAEHFKAACFERAGRELKRETDVASQTPFSAYNLRLFQQTYYGIRDVLEPLVTADVARVVPMQDPEPGKATLIEVCPASTLKREDLYVSYKRNGDAHRRERARLVEAFVSRGVISLARQDLLDTLVSDSGGDAIDAVIAMVAVARYVRDRDRLAPPTGTQRMEGFVYV